MTAEQLIKRFNNKYEIGKEWPKTHEVDMSTYGNVIDAIIKNRIETKDFIEILGYRMIELSVGEHGGIFFKNVELIPVHPKRQNEK